MLSRLSSLLRHVCIVVSWEPDKKKQTHSQEYIESHKCDKHTTNYFFWHFFPCHSQMLLRADNVYETGFVQFVRWMFVIKAPFLTH